MIITLFVRKTSKILFIFALTLFWIEMKTIEIETLYKKILEKKGKKKIINNKKKSKKNGEWWNDKVNSRRRLIIVT